MEQVSLADMIATVCKQWLLIAGITVLVLVLAAAWLYFFVPQEWTAATTIIFERETDVSVGSLGELMYGIRAFRGRGMSETFEEILHSRTIRECVAEEMNLVEVLGVETIREASAGIIAMYETEAKSAGILTVRATWEGPSKAFSAGSDKDDAPRFAADLANILVAALGEFLNEADYIRARVKRRFLEERLEQTEQELLDAEDALVAYATEHNLVHPSSQASAAIDTLNQLGQRDVNLRADLRGARETEQAALERLDAQERMAISSISEQRNLLIDNLHRHILEVQRQIAQQTEVEGKSQQHPDVQLLQTELEEAQAQLADELTKEMVTDSRQLSVDPSYRELVNTALLNSLQRSDLEAKLEVLRAEKERVLAELRAMPSLSAQYEQFQRQVRDKSEAYNRLSEQYETARVAEAASLDQFSVLDPAIPPRRPSAPSLIRSVFLAGFIGFVFATLCAFWRQGREDEASTFEPAEADTSN